MRKVLISLAVALASLALTLVPKAAAAETAVVAKEQMVRVVNPDGIQSQHPRYSYRFGQSCKVLPGREVNNVGTAYRQVLVQLASRYDEAQSVQCPQNTLFWVSVDGYHSMVFASREIENKKKRDEAEKDLVRRLLRSSGQ